MDVLSTMTFYVKPMGHHILEALRRFSSDQNGMDRKCGRNAREWGLVDFSMFVCVWEGGGGVRLDYQARVSGSVISLDIQSRFSGSIFRLTFQSEML